MRAGIALGSNLGNRQAHLTKAVADLKSLHEGGAFLVSTFHETNPLDCPVDAPLFLNAVVELETSFSPLDLLAKLQDLEVAAGRSREHAFHAPRTLDLDLLYCDEMSLDHPDLKLPHPRITERIFVLAPLAEIRPEMRLTGWSMTCDQYLKDIVRK
ncbi:MAG: 2-amino-4-hydroxy-6-hydroxymethyldihydropteridine diphosphokinase [Chthoniobacterales bacterium]